MVYYGDSGVRYSQNGTAIYKFLFTQISLFVVISCVIEKEIERTKENNLINIKTCEIFTIYFSQITQNSVKHFKN